MRPHGSLPRARRDDLFEETAGEELLLYDRNSHTAHCLSPIAAGVWRHCDGERDATELAVLVGVSENLVADALHELREKDLLEAEPQLMRSTTPGISRREAIGRSVRYGAAAAAVPLIVSATAATPAMAASGGCVPGTCVVSGGATCCCCELGCTTKGSATCATQCPAVGLGQKIGEETNKACA
jgi:hypothetical protein